MTEPVRIMTTASTMVAEEREIRWLVRWIVALFSVLAVASLLLWMRYGPDIFFDALAALQSCF